MAAVIVGADPGHGDEYLDGRVRVQSGAFAGICTDIGDIKALDRCDRRLQISILGNTAADDVIDIPFVLGDARIYERLLARAEILEERGARTHLVYKSRSASHDLSSTLLAQSQQTRQ